MNILLMGTSAVVAMTVLNSQVVGVALDACSTKMRMLVRVLMRLGTHAWLAILRAVRSR
jgi:hypothetical protein